MKLTKIDIINEVYRENKNLNREQASEAVEAFLEILKNCLIDGSDVLISGFGKFNVREKRERKGRNPKTGESLMLDARRVVTFTATGKLRDRVNGVD